MFGKLTTTPTTGFSFGSGGGGMSAPASSATNPGFAGGGANTNTTPVGGMFGSTNTNSNQQQSNRPPSLSIQGTNNFIGSAPTTALAQQQQQPQQFGQQTGSLFGQPQTTANTGLFGTAAKPAAATTNAGGLFGQSSAANTGSMFGSQSTSGTTGGLFGQSTAGNAGSMFGQSTAGNTANTGGGGLFGQSTAGNSSTTGGGGLFGQSTAGNTGGGGLFGQSTAGTTGGGGLFGQSTAGNTGGGGLFGQSNARNTNIGGGMQQSFQPFQQQQQQQQQQMQPLQASDHVKNIAAFWNPKSPACHFKFYFYNLVHPSEVHLYQPGPEEDKSLYEQAKANNPEPSCMVPVLAVGFDGLKTRLEMQDEQLKIHKEKIEEFKSRLEKVEQTHTIETIIKIERYRNKQRQIAHRVLQLMKSVQSLRNKGYSLRAEEEALMTRLSSMERDLAKPSVFRGRINEIHAQVQQLKDANRLAIGSYGGVSEDEAFVLTDPQALQPVIQTLEWMSKGLGELTNVVKEDDEALDELERAYAVNP